MTAINAVGHARGAYLMTDTASYHADTAVVTGFGPKVATYPHLGMAVAVTGVGVNAEELNRRMKQFASFDAAVAGAVAMLREAWDEGALDVGDEELSHVRVMLAGWSASEKQGRVYVMSTKEGDEPFVLHTKSISMSPGPSMEELRSIGVLSSDQKTLKFDEPSDFLSKIADLQRQAKTPVPGRPGQFKHIVGGAAVLTVINAAGIHQRVIKRWPDKIGETIDPSRLAEPIAVPAGLSRLQRERMEKKARKGTLRAV